MRPKRFLRNIRRYARVSSGKFTQEEQGTVMVLTIAFALPLCMFLFGTFNTGVVLISRMKAQNVADAASYSASLWQARFLNYCAYTRRHIVGNFATIALCTGYVNSDLMYKNIYKAKDLVLTANQDNGSLSVSTQMKPTRALLAINIPIVKRVRKSSDGMNKWLSLSQRALYGAVALDLTESVMTKVVEDAVGNQQTTFSIDRVLSRSNLIFQNMLERKEIPKDEVKAYYDTYSKANAPNYIAAIGRSSWGGWAGAALPPPPYQSRTLWIFTIAIKSDPITISNTNMKTGDHVIPGASLYCWLWFWISVYGIPVPIPILTPIWDEATEEDYTLATKFSQAKVYEIKNPSKPVEPSSSCVVNVNHDTAPFFSPMQMKPSDLNPAGTTRAFSRSKVYFRGWNENLKNNKYHGQNMNYPFWGAKLAPLTDGTDRMGRAIWLGISGIVTGGGRNPLLENPRY